MKSQTSVYEGKYNIQVCVCVHILIMYPELYINILAIIETRCTLIMKVVITSYFKLSY